MKYDGIFFDSGNTIYGFGQEGTEDPTSADVNVGGPLRAATALRWLGHDVDNLRVAQYLGDWRSLYREVGPSYTEEVLVTRLFEQLGLEPRQDEILYVTGVFSGPRYRSWLYPGVAKTMQQIADREIPMGLIANTSVPGWVMDRNFRGVGLLRFLSVRIYSGDEGVEKPDVEIFRTAEQRSGLAGKRLIYMGDRVDADMAGAATAGWDSVLFRSVADTSDGRATFEIDSWSELPAILA